MQTVLTACLTRARSDVLNAAAFEYMLRVATEVTAGTMAAVEVVEATVTDDCKNRNCDNQSEN